MKNGSELNGITEAKTSKMVFILGMMVFLCNGDNYAASPLIVEIAKDLHLEISQAALSVTAYMLPFGLFTLLFGPLADRFGKTRIITVAAFGTAIFSALGAAAFDLASFNMFVGGGIGTFVNGRTLDAWGFEPVFIVAAALILLASVAATLLLQEVAPVPPHRRQS